MGSVVCFPASGSIILKMSRSKTFGEWLRGKRKAAGLSLQLVAERAGVSKGYLSNLERNAPHTVSGATPRPSLEAVDAIANAVGAPLAEARDAAGYAAPQAEPDPTLSRMLFYFNDLAGDQKQNALAMIEALWHRQHEKRKAEKEAAKHKEQKPKRHSA